MNIQDSKIISGWNATYKEYPLHKCLQQLIEEQVARTPDAVAIRFENQALSYRELNCRANRLAHYLRELAIGPDSLVGVQMQRSLEMMVALLAILKAGGAYLPLDPAYPAERLALILNDASVAVVLTQQRYLEQLADFDGEALCLDDNSLADLPHNQDDPEAVNDSDDLAYVIYTSGSTGRPKGCMLPHKAICNRLLWMQQHYRIAETDRILQKTPFTFDVSVWEFFLPLISGACLVIARPEGHKDPRYLTEVIRAEQITICHFVPSMLRFFLKDPSVVDCLSLQKVFVSGEALTFDLLRQFRQLLTAELHNLYGPTEAAVDVTYWKGVLRDDRRVPIGRPIDNIQIHILDPEGNAVAIGDTGELCIGGVGLARGYLNRPELTAEKFIHDPYSEVAGARLYRTGDKARFLDNGEIELLGRFDSQVKLRGFRIELGEIENTLRSHPAIDDAVVMVKDPESEDPKLAAFVVAKGLDKKAVRDFVKSKLPEHMVPSLVNFIDRIPVTSHGKADHTALLAGGLPAVADKPSAVKSSGEVRQAELVNWLENYFVAALGVDRLAADDDLFDHGATSFTLVQAVARIQKEHQVSLPVEVLLEQPTIAAVTAYMLKAKGIETGGAAQAAADPSPAGQQAGAAAIPLEPIRFDAYAYERQTGDRAPLTLDRFGRFLSLLREVPLDGRGKYLYSSAGGLNAIQFYLYVAKGRIEDVPGGIYYYQPRLNRLLPVSTPATLDPQILLPEQRGQLARAAFALFMIAENDAIAPIYNNSSPSLLILEAGYIEHLLLSRQGDFGLALSPAYGVDFASVAELFRLKPRQRFLHCLIEGNAPADLRADGRALQAHWQQPAAVFADFLQEKNDGFELPSRDALAQLHQEQRQIRRDLPTEGEGVIALAAEPVAADYFRLRAAKRDYLDRSLSFGQLSRLMSLLRADDKNRRLYAGDDKAGLKIYLHLVERGVAGRDGGFLAPGIYRYHSESHSLSRIGQGEPAALIGSYTPFNRKHAGQARFRLFLIAGKSAAYGDESRYFSLLEAGRIGQLLLEQQSEFGLGLCPIGSMYFDRIRDAFALDDSDELVHSFVGGAVDLPLPADWPRLESAAAVPVGSGERLAIVGISGRYPGATSPDELWQNLSAGKSSIRSLSSEELLYGEAADPRSSRWAVGALANKQQFDSLLFHITPAEAKTLDPQERIFLEVVWECLENSGYTADSLKRQAGRVGVFVGVMWADYQHHGPQAQSGERATSFHSAIANRISFFNDFNGPSVAFDTSCSSALTALHFACHSIRQGECRAAIVGGVNLISHPSHLELLSSLELLSDDGQCHPFGLKANGWVAGEGVGALLIKPLEDAERDGDQVLGVIRATAISHSGKTARYGAPSADSQAASIRRVLELAELSPEDISYIEAAAPGASIADGSEFAAIKKVFGPRGAASPLPVGSLKGNIGHLESASALSQLTKVLMQFRYRQIAPTLGCSPLSPMIQLEDSGLAIADRLSDWAETPRRALINAFGASGSGGHLILESPRQRAAVPAGAGPWLFPFAAASRQQLDQLVGAFCEDLQAGRFDDATLGEISYTLCVGRVALNHRLAVVADSREALVRLLQGGDESALFRGSLKGAPQPGHIEEDLDGLSAEQLAAIAGQWVAGESSLAGVARHGNRRVALTSYPFAAIDCHIARSSQTAAVAALSGPESDESLTAALELYLKRQFAEVSGIPESRLDSGETFDRYGLTSLMITSLNRLLAGDFGQLSTTLFFEYQSIGALAGYFAAEHQQRSRRLLNIKAVGRRPAAGTAPQRPAIARAAGRDEPIAIIGLAGRYPGAADVERFWQNLKNGVDSISEIPAERWPYQKYYSEDRSRKGKINTKWGGFLDDFDRFDPLFFNISPRDAERMDPQERLFLETAWHTLEDAGYDRAGLKRHYQGSMGVFVGVMHGEYLLYTRSVAADCSDDAVDSSFGSIANRVSYIFDCHGPSMAVDTICSSSLTALHLAVESLRRGECQVALAGGVNLSLHPNKYFIQSQLNMSSSDGRCRSFGEGGDGFVPGEGVGAVLLKPLSRAEADGDNIYGVIRATSINHDGKTHGYTVPNPNAQGAMIAESLDKAGMDPRELSYIEAHGTGTALGDPVEITGLRLGFARRTATLGSEALAPQQCAIGSVKSNIGHLESAAGIAGVTKVLLQLKYRQLAPSLHSSRLNPGIHFADSPFYVPQQLETWPRPVLNLDGRPREYARAASVSSFGSGGSNAHVIIAEYVPPPRDTKSGAQQHRPEIILLSARAPKQLRQQASRLLEHLQRAIADDADPHLLADLAYTLQQGREAMECRLAFTAASLTELRDKLAQSVAALDQNGDHAGALEGIYIDRVKDNKATMAILARDDDMAEALAAWLDKGKYHKLLALWVKGLAIDWAALNRGLDGKRRRISLPTYPFAGERIWVSGESHYSPQGHAGGREGRLHPLLHSNVSDLGRQKFASVFSGHEFFLRDHRIRRHKVLPGVSYLEMAREAISRSLGEAPAAGALMLQNVVWSQPVMLDEQGDGDARVEIRIDSLDEQRLAFEIVQERQEPLCCQGEAVFVQGAGEDAVPLASLQAAIDGHRLDADGLYRLFDGMEIHYGPCHRPVQEVRLQGDQVLARIELPQELNRGDRHQFVLHPSLIDGALQSTIGLLVAEQLEQGLEPVLEQTWVPFALAQMRLETAALGERIWAWVRPSHGQHAPEHPKLDIDLYNERGERCVVLQGFALRIMKKPSPLELFLEDRPQSAYYLMEKWRRISPENRTRPAQRILLVGDGQQQHQQLGERYANAVSLILKGDESIEQICEQLTAVGQFEQLIWLAPTAAEHPGEADGMIRAQNAGVLSCFRLIKALQALEMDQQALEWTVITRGTQTVYSGASSRQQAVTEPVFPAHASLHGLVGVIAKEYSHWGIRLVDLQAGDDWPAIDLLSLPTDASGNALACRDNRWYQQYLASCLPVPEAEPQESLYRKGGVYLVVGGAGGIGRIWSEYLIRRYQGRVIWIGRRPADQQIEAVIAELAKLGPAPLYISADASNRAALQQAVAQINERVGAINGVIHAAIQLEDQSLARMEQNRFTASLTAKVDISVRLAEAFEHHPLDFMLFFSSLQSFTKSGGQSNYAAGCTFKNAFAYYLAQNRAYPVKVINWGYWGSVGSVATEAYRRRMAAVGLGSIDGEQAMAALETLLARPLSQLIYLKTSQRLADAFAGLALPAHTGGVFGEYGEIRPAAYPSLIARLKKRLAVDSRPVRNAEQQVAPHRAAIDGLYGRLLYGQLQQLGWFARERETLETMKERTRLDPRYHRWIEKSLDELAQRGYLQFESGDGPAAYWLADRQPLTVEPLWAEWAAHKPVWLEHAALRAEVILAEATLWALPEILVGRVAATDIMFPDSSVALVEGIYKHNPLSDFFNDVMLDAMVEFVRGRLEEAPESRIRIIEIGAGTGGTSARAFEKLRPYRQQISEYCYTDVSQAFLLYAQETYGPDNPYLTYELFNVAKPLAEQGIEVGAYDLVIATNVLHATPDMRQTVKNTKAALKHNGLVMINEICRNGLFTHLTFGLLDGWWLFDDPELRLPGGPALAPKQWKRVLESEGYRHIVYPALAEHDLGQQIVIAESNGIIWQDNRREIRPAKAAASRPAAAAQPAARPQRAVVAKVPAVEVTSQLLKDQTVGYLKQVIGELFKIRPEEIDAREPLETYGIDSILVVQLTNLLRNKLSGISSTLFFEYQTIDALAEHFIASQRKALPALLGLENRPPAGQQAPQTVRQAVLKLAGNRFAGEPAERTAAVQEAAQSAKPGPGRRQDTEQHEMRRGGDVAIIGLAGRYAGSDNVQELWQHLKNGDSCVSEVPADRWDWRDYSDEARAKKGKICTRWGGFLREIDKFDALFFHISPREAEKMDPQERLFLEEAYHCISDAGYTPRRLAENQRVGVFVGVMNGTYSRLSSYWSVANRVSYQFNFQGPSLAVDTACSSSITAVHLALESLHSGTSDCVLVGGVNVVIDPVHFMRLTEMKMLSPGNQCKAFGIDADGFVFGEGVGALLLKPLAQAEADGDHIYGVIKGSMINAGGKTNGYTVPNPLAQSRLVADSLARAGVDARAVSYVEAHGTGTALGDPIEIAGLTRAFDDSTDTPARQYCALGSIKTNIGHCESAAGIAGITKVLLQLKHRQLVPSLHASVLNPEIDFANSPFVVQQELAEWRHPEAVINGQTERFKRIATVSSFGAGGAYAHVVIEEYEDTRPQPAISIDEQRPAIILLSAKTEPQLLTQAALLLAELEQGKFDDSHLPALAYTLQVGREAMEQRLGLLITSLADLKTRLREFIDNPGQGAHYYRGGLKEHHNAFSLFAEEDMQNTIAGWIRRGQHGHLLEVWVNGLAVDWRQLYRDGAPRRISLPGYPFARERYWRAAEEETAAPATGSDRLHPLVHRNVSDLRGLRYLSRFGEKDALLADHQINGRGLLPGAACIGMIHGALLDALGGELPAGQAMVIRELEWRQPFSVDATNGGKLYLELSPEQQGECNVGIYSYDASQQLQQHCRARAGAATARPPTMDFDPAGARELDIEACYRLFAAMGITYGPTHRGIRSLQRRGNQALARIALSNEASCDGHGIHPALLDAALQSAIGLLSDTLGERPPLLLPQGIEQFVLFKTCPARLQVQIRSAGQQSSDYRFDLGLFDDSGECCAAISGFTLKRLPGLNNGATSGLLCTRQWRETPVTAAAVPVTAAAVEPALSQLVLTVGEHNAFGGLPALLERSGRIRCRALAGDGDYAEVAIAMAGQLKTLLSGERRILVQLVIPLDHPQGYRGLGGLLSCVSREEPAIVGQLVEVESALNVVQLAQQLAGEAADPRERQIRYLSRGGVLRREELAWQGAPLADGRPPWRDRGVYLITGGLGGIGMILAQAIARFAPEATIILSGRSTADSVDMTGKLAQLPGSVHYRSADLGDREQVEQLIQRIVRDHGALHGILHCAGITRDCLLQHKTRADFDTVFAAKVAGARHLDLACADLALDFFVLCSSVASVLGNPGQSDYGAANGYLDAFAGIRNRQAAAGERHGRTLSINWPLWLGGGMQMSDAARRALADATGIEAMASETGVAALYQALESGEDQVMVLAGDIHRLQAMLKSKPAPVDGGSLPASGQELLADLRSLLARTLKMAESRLDNDEPFEKYGVDSLMIMDMTAELEKRFGPLSRTLFFEYASLQRLADHLTARFGGLKARVAQAALLQPQTTPAGDQNLAVELRRLLATTLKTPESRIDSEQCFEHYGIDSLMIMEMTSKLEKRFGPLSPTLFFEYASLQRLTHYLTARYGEVSVQPGFAPAVEQSKPARAGDQPRQRLFDADSSATGKYTEAVAGDAGIVYGGQDIAIIGIAGRYPQSADLESFWQNLRDGKDCIGEIPAERWDWREYYSPDRRKSGVHYSKWGGFIDGVDQFDPLFFNISPLEAELIDPQERLFLQTAWSAMEDAGYCRRTAGEQADCERQIGVYAGVMYSEYQMLGVEASLRGQRMGFAGSNASIANRVSFCLNLHGPSMTVDSMCSSSLTAIHLACQDLRSGRTSMAIAGGVNVTIHPNKYLMLSSGQYISGQGHCASFGEGGDGYVPGEGVGAVILKRLADAERDGDHIYAVIKGSYLNHGGRSTGYSVPDPRAQQAVIGGALEDAGVDPAAISYIEAHGTGTRLGDPIEIAGLVKALGDRRQPGQLCWLGSVKSNIGHCESAAGIAGLTKVLLQLKHGQIAPSLHSQRLNPFIDFAATPFEVNQQLREWPQPVIDGKVAPRLAGISSFGAGGSNGHLVVAEYCPAESPASVTEGKRNEMILLSARNPERLQQVAARLLDWLQRPAAGQNLTDIAYTLQVGREAMESRAALIVADILALIDALQQLCAGDKSAWFCGDAETASEQVQQFKQQPQWREQLAGLFAKGDHRQLLALWCGGLAIDWPALWAGRAAQRRRISLPTYPFAIESYWAPVIDHLPAQDHLHPLLHRNLSGFDQQRFSTCFDGNEPWLRDHRVNGLKTLPGAAYLEMIRLAVIHSLDDAEAPGMVIEQLTWLTPLTVEKGQCRLQIRLEKQAAQIRVEVISEDAGQVVLHCQARVKTRQALAGERIDLPVLRERRWQRWLDGETVYRLFDEMSICYGDSQRGIRELMFGEDAGRREVLAALALDDVLPGGAQAWILPPGILDSALQAAIGMLLPLNDSQPGDSLPLLPFALERLEIIAPCQMRMWARVRANTAARQHRPAGKVDIELCDEQGRICVRLLGLSSRHPGQAVATASGPEEQLHLLAPTWSEVSAADGVQPSGQALLFGASPDRQPILSRIYPGIDMAELADDSEAAYLAELAARPTLEQVIWLAPSARGLEPGSLALITAQQQGVLSLFRLIKALLQQGYDRRPLRLTLITESAVRVLPGERCQLAHASVHGLAGSLANEYQHWRVQLADFGDGELAGLARAPFDGAASGELVALRQGQWYRQQLARVTAAPALQNAASYRKGGVYLVIGGAGGIGEVWSRYVMERYRARVIWLGRRPLDGPIKARLDALTAHGLRHNAPAPVYLQADATDEQQLGAARQHIIERFGQINGVVHSAIVLRDQSLAKMDEQRFRAGLDAKVAISVMLARSFGRAADPALDFVLFFSSMMSYSKSAGQSNYAAGCTFADAFADRLRADWRCAVKVINWGYWGSVGVVTDAGYRQKMAALGLASIEPEEGMQALELLLAGGLEQLALLKTRATEGRNGLESIDGLLGDEQLTLYPDGAGGMAGMQDRMNSRLAALAPPADLML